MYVFRKSRRKLQQPEENHTNTGEITLSPHSRSQRREQHHPSLHPFEIEQIRIIIIIAMIIIILIIITIME